MPVDDTLVAPPVRPRYDEGGEERANIFKDDLIRFGYTVGCQGCKAAVRGKPAHSHTEECRKRIEDELRKESNTGVQDADERRNKDSRQEESPREEQQEGETKEKSAGGQLRGRDEEQH